MHAPPHRPAHAAPHTTPRVAPRGRYSDSIREKDTKRAKFNNGENLNPTSVGHRQYLAEQHKIALANATTEDETVRSRFRKAGANI